MRHRDLHSVLLRLTGEDVCQEKLEALALDAQNVLITARAGSGKTKTIALKVALSDHNGIPPDQILALSFNRNAAHELGNRMLKYGASKIPSSTFHALAYAIVRPKPGALVYGDRQMTLLRSLLGTSSDKISQNKLEEMRDFIVRTKHSGLDPAALRERGQRIGGLAATATRLYDDYTILMRRKGWMDFDDLIEMATERLQMMPHTSIIRLNDNRCDLGSLKLVCLDEFQDFSRLFYGLISALRDTNSSMGVYAVGDDWQAINGFAGSDLEYFNNFDAYFGNSAKANLLTNYRSGKAIVEYANKQMRGLGNGGMALQDGGKVEQIKINRGLGGVSVPDALKRVLGSIAGSVMILSRRNVLHGMDLTEWQDKLVKFGLNARVSTIHKAKGTEADTVVVVNEPGNHANSQLKALMGLEQADVEQEERRINYVASTRARRQLVVIN
ncbi:MAG: UvrD-helicase domain-containing protein [Patescibacteria group bacterium]